MQQEGALRVVGALLLGLGGARGWWLGGLLLWPWGAAGMAGGVVVGFFLLPYPARGLGRWLRRLPTSTVLLAVAGLLAGLVSAMLLSLPLFRLPGPLGWALPLGLVVALGGVGAWLMASRERELGEAFPALGRLRGAKPVSESPILVDTSAVIDGRIADLVDTGFLRGSLAIPQFVLDELRHIADSPDPLRRGRGRRGLEVLNRLRKGAKVPVQVLDIDLGREREEVDARLVRLAQQVAAPILTTDFNLNRVAELQGVQVLNINDLANALKPVVLPGEEMNIRIIQEGKEPGQGVGFLEDGTMVVVDGGKRLINSYQDVVVTRVLQTPAGRIIFAQPKGA